MSKPAAQPRPRRVSRQREAGEATRRETRRRILVAAAAEFAERSWTGATVVRIAERADVAVPTLYAAWGSKRSLLRAVMAQAVTEHDDGFNTDAVDRHALLGPPAAVPVDDPVAYLTYLARRYRLIAERSAVGWRTYRDGAAVDAEIAADWQQLHEGRRKTFIVLLDGLPATALRPGHTIDSAVDTVWAIASPETHELFVVRRGWTYDHYEEWVADTLTATLLR